MPALAAAVDASQTHLAVNNPAQSLKQGQHVRVDNEVMRFEGYGGDSRPGKRDFGVWMVRRGQSGTAAASHESGANIQAAVDAFLAGTFSEPPSPFDAAGGGGITVTGGTTTAEGVQSVTLERATLTEGEPGEVTIEATGIVARDSEGTIRAQSTAEWSDLDEAGSARQDLFDDNGRAVRIEASWDTSSRDARMELVDDGLLLAVVHISNLDGAPFVYLSCPDSEGEDAPGIMLRRTGGIPSVRLTGLPTSNPNVADHLWNDNGTLKVSAG